MGSAVTYLFFTGVKIQISEWIQISAHTQNYAHTRMFVVQTMYFAEKFPVHFSPPEPGAQEYSSV